MVQDKKRQIPKGLHHHEEGIEDLLLKMPEEEMFFKAADVFSQLGDSSRLRILWLLCHSEACVNDIATAVDMSAPAVSHHLRNLKQANIIRGKRIGKEVLYTLEDSPKANLIHKMIDDIFEINCPQVASTKLEGI